MRKWTGASLIDVLRKTRKASSHWGRGNTVTDYIIGEKRVRDRIERMKVGEKVDLITSQWKHG